jgi:DNA-binding response OmpR family regulator
MKRVLVVDDCSDLRFLYSEIFQQEGFEVISAENGRVALYIIENSKYAFDVILTDHLMPVMNGEEFIQEIRGQGNSTPVVFISGLKDHKISGADCVLLKPIDIDVLLNSVTSLILNQRS